jgi:hypothetical protein
MARRTAAADDSPPPFSPPDVTRLRANHAFSVLLPIIFISSISWVAFLIDPTGLSLRMSIVLTSLVSLLALQFVIQANLPSSSYVLPTKVRRVATLSVVVRRVCDLRWRPPLFPLLQQLVLLTYASLAIISFESVAVFELSRWPQRRAARAEHKAALESVAQARERDARQRDISGFRAWFAGPPNAAQLSHLYSVQLAGRDERRPSSSGDGRHNVLVKDADTPEGVTATGRHLEAYYLSLAHRVNICTFAFVAITYTCAVVGILLGGLTNQANVRRPLPPAHAARVVPLPPMPAPVAEMAAP